jgi:hypothetical protein
MKRIRYVKQPDGSLVSMQVIVTNRGDVRSLIFPDGVSGQIIDAGNHKAVGELQRATSGHKIKMKLKSQLISLGVTFDDESRSTNEADEASEG